MPVHSSSEARVRGRGRGWLVFSGVLLALAAAPLALYLFPAPVRVGSIVVLGPYSNSRLDFRNGQSPTPDPNPAHVYMIDVVHRGRTSVSCWAREFHYWGPFLVLLGVDYPRQVIVRR